MNENIRNACIDFIKAIEKEDINYINKPFKVCIAISVESRLFVNTIEINQSMVFNACGLNDTIVPIVLVDDFYGKEE